MISRRRFLARSAALAVVATACSDGDGAADDDPDADLATTGARMERVIVDTYTWLRTIVVQGRLGAAVPQAFVEFLTAATGHHQEHLRAWAGAGGVDSPDPELRQAVDRVVARLADIPAAVSFALRLEDLASRTYLEAIPRLRTEGAVRTAGQILVVDQQHQTVLRHLLGLPPTGSGVGRDTRDFAPADPGLGVLSTP